MTYWSCYTGSPYIIEFGGGSSASSFSTQTGINTYVAFRFMPYANVITSGASLACGRTKSTGFQICVGLQGDSSGDPNGTYLCSGLTTIVDSVEAINDIMWSNTPISSGVVYHLVIQPFTGSWSAGSYVSYYYSQPVGSPFHPSPPIGSMNTTVYNVSGAYATSTNSGGTWTWSSPSGKTNVNPHFGLYIGDGSIHTVGGYVIGTTVYSGNYVGLQFVADQTLNITSFEFMVDPQSKWTVNSELWCYWQESGGTTLGSAVVNVSDTSAHWENWSV